MGPVPCNFRSNILTINESPIELEGLVGKTESMRINFEFNILDLKKGYFLEVKPKLIFGSTSPHPTYEMSLVESSEDDIGKLVVSTNELMAHDIISLKCVMESRAQLSHEDFDVWLVHKYIEAFSHNYYVSTTLSYESGLLIATFRFERSDEEIMYWRFQINEWDSKTDPNIVPDMRVRQAVG